ncbi:MAG: GAF domain-containing protein [Thermoflexibacter sp.]|nr:GAF domain-containing protein [Thermoflexibacter sp.]
MKKLSFRRRLIQFFGIVLLVTFTSISLLIYIYLRNNQKVVYLELIADLEQSATSLSFHALNYADGERTSMIDISNDISEFDNYFNTLKNGSKVVFRQEEISLAPLSDSPSKDIISQLETEWAGYKENLQKITNSKPDRIDINAQRYIVNNVGNIKKIIKSLSDHIYQLIQEDNSSYISYLLTFVIFLLIIFSLELIGISYFLLKPINDITHISERVAKGELVNVNHKTSIIKEIDWVIAKFDEINQGLDKITDFADKIGDGDFSANLNPRSEKDQLTFALLEMRDNLLKVNQDEQKRKWATEGLAKFASILRLDEQDRQKLADAIISNLVKYVGANQGGLFIHDPNQEILRLVASYAYNRKKFIEREIPVGDGLIGQTFVEKNITYIKDIPDGYVYITSGLGEATPSNLLLIPLKANEKVFGVVELTSFEQFEPYQLEFLEKVAENIAATISSFRNTEIMSKLLRESQEQSEMLRSQEEEMRQNFEELLTTQEQMKRKQEEVEITNRKLQANEMILKKAMEKTKEQSQELQKVNEELAQKQIDMHQQMIDLQKAKDEISQIKEEEQKRAKMMVDQQKKLMAHGRFQKQGKKPQRAIGSKRKRN